MSEYKARPHEVHLRLSEEEYRALEKKRAKCRLPQQTYLRKLCMEIQPKEQPPVDFFRANSALQSIKGELHTIAMIARQDGWMDADLYWENFKRIENEIEEIRKQILY